MISNFPASEHDLVQGADDDHQYRPDRACPLGRDRADSRARLGFAVYCLFDLSRSEVRYLPKWAWAVLCVVSIPVGGIVYLLAGRVHR